MKKIYLNISMLLVLASLTNLSPVMAQEPCGFDRMMELAKLQNPDFERSRQQVEAFTRDYASRVSDRSGTVVKIPTVVHVVHNGEVVGTYPNMSDAQILSGIDNLNKAFKNTDIYSGTAFYNNPMDIEFVLAKVSPKGVTSTGIERHNVTSKSYAGTYNANGISNDSPTKPGVPQAELFGDFLWNPQDYMNIWLVKKINGVDTGSGGSGTLGYATLPLSNPGTTDGLVCQARAFGYYVGYDHDTRPADFDFGPSPSNLNGTANHEVGHYLNLQHTFNGDGGDGSVCPPVSGVVGVNDDGCADIPPHKRTDSICPDDSSINPSNVNECTGGGPNEYIHNFMDYSTDECFQGFSADQKTRCEAAVNGPRKAFITSIADDAAAGTFPSDVPATVLNPEVKMGIYDVTLNGVTFTSQNAYNDGGYLNRIASQPTVDLAYSTQYTMTVQVSLNSNQFNEIVNVYIDFNNNNVFNETNERVYQTAAGAGKTNGDVFSFMFTTPTAGGTPAANQRIRMRIISGEDGENPITSSTTT